MNADFELRDIDWVARIKDLRKKMNLTQRDLAAILTKSAPAINHWEKGIRRPDACDKLFLVFIEERGDAAVKALESIPISAGWPAERVKRAREALGWTPFEMSRILGIPMGSIDQWERSGLAREQPGCSLILYSLLEAQDKDLLDFLLRR